MTNTTLNIMLKAHDLTKPEFERMMKNVKTTDKNLNTMGKTGKKSFSGMTNSARQFNKIMMGLGGVGMLLGMKKLISSGIEFESAFAGVKKTVEATDAEFQQLSEDLIAMSLEIPIAAKDLARIEELAGQLGVSGVKNLSKFTETVAKIGVTTNLTEEAAATSFARIANIIQEPIDNIDRMGAAVVQLGNTSATTESEIVEFANRIAGAGKVAGLSTADLFGFGAAFSSVGVGAERGGTAVSKALLMMGEAVSNGGDELKDFAKIAGVTAEEFSRIFREDAGKVFAMFIEGVGSAGIEGAAILDKLELSDQRLKQAFLSVGGASGILTSSLQTANKAFEDNDALTEEAEKRFATTESKLKLLGNQFAEIGLNINEGLLPVLNSVISVIGSGMDKVAEFATVMGEASVGGATGEDLANDPRMYLIKILQDQGLSGEDLFNAAEAYNLDDLEELPEKYREITEEINADLDENSPMNKLLPNEEEMTEAFEAYMEKQRETVEEARMLWVSWNDEKSAAEQARIKTELAQYKFMTDTKKKSEESFWNTAGKLKDQFSTGISGMFKDMIRGNLTVEESFKKLGLAMVDILIDYAVQLVVNKLLASVMQDAMIGETAAAMGTIGAAAAGPAAAVSLATMGGNSAPAMIGIAATHALSAGLVAIPGLEEGGSVTGAGLTLVGEAGPELLDLPRGASVIPLDRAGGGSTINVEIVINNPFMSTDEQAQAVGAMIAQQVSEAIAEEEERI